MNVAKVLAFLCIMAVVLGMSVAGIVELQLPPPVFRIALIALGLGWIIALLAGTLRIHSTGKFF